MFQQFYFVLDVILTVAFHLVKEYIIRLIYYIVQIF